MALCADEEAAGHKGTHTHRECAATNPDYALPLGSVGSPSPSTCTWLMGSSPEAVGTHAASWAFTHPVAIQWGAAPALPLPPPSLTACSAGCGQQQGGV